MSGYPPGGSSTPSGAAGGDLAGTYPNPALAAIGAATGPLGTTTRVPVVTIDAKGRTTALTDAAIAFPAAVVSSVFTRTGAVVAGNADYLAVAAGGLTGAVAATRYVGGTASVAPTTGTFAVGDFVVSQTGHIFVCTVAGTPGTWVDAGSVGNLVTSVFGRTGVVAATAGDYTMTKVTANAAFSVYLAGNTSITQGAFRLVPFDSAEFNIGGYVDLATNKGRFTPPAGYYQLGFILSAQSSGLGWIARLYKNGSYFKSLCQTDATLSTNPVLPGTCSVQANGTDYFEVFVLATATASLFGGAQDTIFFGNGIGS